MRNDNEQSQPQDKRCQQQDETDPCMRAHQAAPAKQVACAAPQPICTLSPRARLANSPDWGRVTSRVSPAVSSTSTREAAPLNRRLVTLPCRLLSKPASASALAASRIASG